MARLEVVRGGALTTVQDLGRWGWQGSGVPVAGPMDAYSHRLANRRAGNADEAGALEVTITGPVLRARGAVVCAVAGADFVLAVDGRGVDVSRAFAVGDSAILRFGARRAGARATLAVRGGLDVPEAFGSRATSVTARLGPFGGRGLREGDELEVGTAVETAAGAGRPLTLPAGGARLRVIVGPDEHRFSAAAVRTLCEARFVVSAAADRMGYRLDGAALPAPASDGMLSSPTPMGTLQVTPAGLPILLMAERPTTGGYPRIATVISADLPLAGQLAPGDWIRFEACTPAAARAALAAQEAALRGEAC